MTKEIEKRKKVLQSFLIQNNKTSNIQDISIGTGVHRGQFILSTGVEYDVVTPKECYEKALSFIEDVGFMETASNDILMKHTNIEDIRSLLDEYYQDVLNTFSESELISSAKLMLLIPKDFEIYNHDQLYEIREKLVNCFISQLQDPIELIKKVYGKKVFYDDTIEINRDAVRDDIVDINLQKDVEYFRIPFQADKLYTIEINQEFFYILECARYSNAKEN